MNKRIFQIAASLLIGWMICPAPAQAEMVDSLLYQSWRSHKLGAKVMVRNETSAQGMSLVQNITYTLLEITPDKAVIEMAVQTSMRGFVNETKAKQEIAARIDSTEQNLPVGLKGSVKQVGTETVDVNGKKVNCKVYEFTGQGPQGTATGKAWQTIDIPGNFAKTEMDVQSAKMAATIKMSVVSVAEGK
jgi:hypothetical protein